MLSEATADQCRRLLEEGLSRRQVALRLAISRTSVNKIARGEWHPGKPRSGRSVPKYRCPGCRQMVNLDPCFICQIRRQKDGDREAAKTKPDPRGAR